MGERAENPPEYGPEDAARIKKSGTRMVKVTPIWVEQAPPGSTVLTREGELMLMSGGWIATDGKSVWPVAEDFLRENYRAEEGEDEGSE